MASRTSPLYRVKGSDWQNKGQIKRQKEGLLMGGGAHKAACQKKKGEAVETPMHQACCYAGHLEHFGQPLSTVSSMLCCSTAES